MNLFDRTIVALLPFVPKPIVAQFAKPYIAGITLSEAVITAQKLQSTRAMLTMDVLGEDISHRDEAIAARDQCIAVLDTIADLHLDSNISIKLTQLGLKIDKTFCMDNVRMIVEKAKGYGNFVRIDMEDHTCTDDTLGIYRAMRQEFGNVGVVIQAYLKRSEADTRKLAAEGANIRLCKGIYNEPAEIAIKDRKGIQDNFNLLLRILLEAKCYVGIATHDDVLITAAERLITELKLAPPQYEFQMLLGVRPERRRELIECGHRLRVYTPFGKSWYAYSTRRLKENPAMAGYVFKAIFDRG